MTAPLKSIEGSGDIAGRHGRNRPSRPCGGRVLALAPADQKNRALAGDGRRRAGPGLRDSCGQCRRCGRSEGRRGHRCLSRRLSLDPARVEAIAAGIEAVRDLNDPVGIVTESWIRPNGMRIERVRVPLGVVGIIYESRPNVTADAAVLCLKAGNAAILRGGSDSMRSSRAILAALTKGLAAAGLPEAAVQLVPTRDRAAVGLMLQGLDGNIDVIVPPWRKEPGGAGAGRGPRAGIRAPRRGLPCVRDTARRRSTWPRKSY